MMSRLVLLVMLLPAIAAGQETTAPSPRARIAVWDTGRSIAGRLGPAFFSDRTGWSAAARNEKNSSFRGDVVMANGRILAVFRKQDPAVEVCSVEPQGPIPRVRLELLARSGAAPLRLTRMALVENTRSAARLEVAYATEQGAELSASFRIRRGDVSLQAAPGPGAGRLRLRCPSRFVALPDFFADDILMDASKIPVRELEAPSENFLLHFAGNEDAIVMCVFENRQQDVKILLSDNEEERIATGSEIDFGAGRKIWVALMTAPRIWHSMDVDEEDVDRTIALDWTMPFAAQWRVDFTRANDLTDSWEMLLQKRGSSGYLKPAWLGRGATPIQPDRKRWTTVLGWFRYPCWTDAEGRGYVQPLKHRRLMFRGPAVIYPINRVPETPIDSYTVVDVVRSSLGVGPCQYILDVEGQQQKHVGQATCAARDALKAIYEKNQQQERRDEVEKALDNALAFVTHIRSRITLYIEFGKELRRYLESQKRAQPELSEQLDQLEQIAAQIDERLAQRREKIKTPQYVAEMNQDFRQNLLNYNGPDVLERLKQYTDELTQIGANQDELVGECRWIVRVLRQRAGIMMATDPQCAAVAEEIRSRTREVLAKPARYEAARH
jgi:hypothetical protein